MHLGNNTEGSDQGDGELVIPANASDPAFVEGRYYLFTLTWGGVDGILYTSELHEETVERAKAEAMVILEDHKGYSDARLGNQNGVWVPIEEEPLAPVTYMLNFKLRRALMCRGDDRVAEAMDRGFKKVTPAHFVKYLDNAKNGFRTKKKSERPGRKVVQV